MDNLRVALMALRRFAELERRSIDPAALRRSLGAFAQALTLADPELLVSAAELIEEQRYELEFLSTL